MKEWTKKHTNFTLPRGIERISFFQINAKLREYKPQDEPDELATAALGLSFKVQPYHLGGRGLELECSLSIGAAYWQRVVETIPVAPREQPAISGNWWNRQTSSGRRRRGSGSKSLCLQILVIYPPTAGIISLFFMLVHV